MPWNRKRYETDSRASGIALVNNLMLRNKTGAQRYREAAAVASEPEIIGYLESLASNRESLHQELYRLMEDMPPVPLPASRQGRSFIAVNWGEFREALLLNNTSRITAFCLKSERNLAEAYREAVAQEGVPTPIFGLLNKQLRHLLAVQRQVERMERVPAGQSGARP